MSGWIQAAMQQNTNSPHVFTNSKFSQILYSFDENKQTIVFGIGDWRKKL